MNSSQHFEAKNDDIDSSGRVNPSLPAVARLSIWAEVVVFGLVYMLVSILTSQVMSNGDFFNLHLPQGLALAVVILKGPAMLVGLFAGQFCASLANVYDVSGAFAEAVAYTLANLAAFQVLKTYQFDKRLTGATDYFILIFVAAGTAFLASSVAMGFVLLEDGLQARMTERFVLYGFGDLMASITLTPLLLLWFGGYSEPERIEATNKKKLMRYALALATFGFLHELSHVGGHMTESHLVDFAFMALALAVALYWGLRVALAGASVYVSLLAFHPKVAQSHLAYEFLDNNLLYHPVFESGLFSLFAIVLISALALNLREKHYQLQRNIQIDKERSHLIGVKKDMIRTFGHEIGTPLAALQHAVDKICSKQQGNLLPEHLEAVGQIKRIKRTSSLLQNYYSLVSGEVKEVHCEQANFQALTVRLKSLIAELDPMGRVELILDQKLRDASFELPTYTFLAMSEELIRNALDHSAEALDEVKVGLELFNGGLQQQVGLSVVNPIRPQQVAVVRQISERMVIEKNGHCAGLDAQSFEFGEDSDHHRDGHLGLGLAVASRFARLAKARIYLRVLPQSKEVMARMHLPVKSIPARPVVQDEPSKPWNKHVDEPCSLATVASQPEAGRESRIYVVDDSPLNLKMAQARLAQPGLPIEVYSDPEEAVVQIIHNAQAGDVVLMDLQMPVLSGYECTRLIRQALPNMRLTVFAYTASSELECGAQLAASGMNGFLAKTDSNDVLRQKVLDALGPLPQGGKSPVQAAQLFAAVSSGSH